MELLVLKRQKEYKELYNLMHKYEEELHNHQEPEPEATASWGGVILWCIIAAILCLFAVGSSALIRLHEVFLYVSLLTLPVVAICIFALLRSIHVYRRNSARYAHYEQKMQKYQNEQQSRDLLLEQIAECKKQMVEFVEQSNVLSSIRHGLYSANVIPTPFRTLYAVRYLFNYFQSSKADDVDVVLQIFAIEELRQNHIQISEKEAERILHQRVLLANQVMGDSLQRQSVEAQLMEIANRDENTEFRIQYLKRIHANQDVSSFFFQQVTGL